jgi:hypothetical protein
MHYRRLYLAVLTLMLVASPFSAQTQKTAEAWAEWETITPEGEEFTVTMPKNPTTEAAKFPYHKMELNTRLYLAKSTTGPVVAVASFSGIKANLGSEFARFNSYIDAFKDFFPPKVRTKDTALTKLTLVSNRPFNGHTGRSYKIAIGELNGVLHAFVTRKRFYAIVSLNTKKDDALEEKFLSSFSLPPREPDQPKTTAANQGEQPPQPGAEQTIDDKPPSAEQKQALPQGEEGATNVAPKKEGEPGAGGEINQPQNADGTQKRAPINVGVLNTKAIYMPRPEAPPDATGVVLVQVLVDEQGSVIDAKAVSGPQNLHAISVTAARLARFMPTLVAGVPVQVTGTLSYNFVRSN